jgi:hypothetical protein
MSAARRALADAIEQRAPLAAEAQTIDAAMRRLSSLVVAEQKAAESVAAIESALSERMLVWARTSGQDPPALADGADLPGAYELLQKARAQGAAARAAEPELQREIEAVLARRAALENSIKAHALDVLGEIASEITERIAEHERAIGCECANLAALRRPLMRLVGLQGATKAISAINTTIEARRFAELDVPALEQRYQALADRLLADASATLQLT